MHQSVLTFQTSVSDAIVCLTGWFWAKKSTNVKSPEFPGQFLVFAAENAQKQVGGLRRGGVQDRPEFQVQQEMFTCFCFAFFREALSWNVRAAPGIPRVIPPQ